MTTTTLEGFVLSPLQKTIFMQTGGDFCATALLEWSGPLDIDALQHAFREVLVRHEILRTRFPKLAAMSLPLQAPGEEASFSFELPEAVDSVEPIENPGVCRPFDLQRDPPVRVRLVRRTPRDYLVSLTLPTVCMDSAGLALLLEELLAGYAGHSGTDEEPLQYADFADWQTEILDEPETEYWIRNDWVFPGRPLPRETAMGEDAAPAPEFFEAKLDSRLDERIQTFCNEFDRGQDPFFLACWQVYLGHLLGGEPFTLGTCFDLRSIPNLAGALGLYRQHLPLPCQLDPKLAFEAFLTQTEARLAEMEANHPYFSWDLLPETSRRLPELGYEYLTLADAHVRGDFRIRTAALYSRAQPFKLKLHVTRKGSAHTLAFEYDPSRLKRDTIACWCESILALLDDAATRPGVRLADLAVLGEAERRRLLVTWNGAEHEISGSGVIHRRFEIEAARQPEAPALASGHRVLTFAALNRGANRLARVLRAHGVVRETAVALYLPRSLDAFVGLLAVLKAGGAYLPIDPNQPEARTRAMLANAGVSTAIAYRKKLDPDLPLTCIHPRAGLNEPETDLEIATDADDPAYLLFTSGSTGTPKGVVVRHGAVVNLAHALGRCFAFGSGRMRVGLNAPLVFDASVKQIVQLLFGHTLVILPESIRPDGDALLAFLARNRLDSLDLTPAQTKLLLATNRCRPEDLPARLLLGGEAIDAETWQALRAMDAERFFNIYGPTECTDVTTVSPLSQTDSPQIGRPLTNVRVYVLSRSGNMVPMGVPGELTIAGSGLARGYHRRPARTAARFLPDPFGHRFGARMYRSGDRVRFLDNGCLEFLGRTDRQVKLRGYRIEPGEVEAVLRRHPAVRDCAVQARRFASGDVRLMAWVLPDTGTGSAVSSPETGTVSAELLREHAGLWLPEHMVPGGFVFMDAFPLTSRGKIDYAALPDAKEEGVGLDARPEGPDRQLEELLVGIWRELLEVGTVEPHANFFALGGHSLLATRLVASVRQSFGVDLGLRAIFDRPTLGEFCKLVAAEIEAGRGVEKAPILPLARTGDLPLSFAQQRLWFSQKLRENETYTIPFALRLQGRLRIRVLARCFNELISRHEILRTTFPEREGRPVQVIAERAEPAFHIVDLREAPLPPERETALIRAASGRPFDLARGPLLRLTLLWQGPESHILLVTMHHLISDGWSTGVLVRELGSLYEAFSSGRPSPLEPLAIQYADFADWQRRHLSGRVLDNHLAFWKTYLQNAPPLLKLPTDRPRPPIQKMAGASQSFRLDPDASLALEELSRDRGVTLFMTLQAALTVLLADYSGQEDIVIGTTIANRNTPGIEALIGLFVNTLVLRTDLSGDPPFHELLGRIRKNALDAHAHQDLPFEKLVEALKPKRDMSYHPLFQVKFVFQNAPAARLALPGLTVSALDLENDPARCDLLLIMMPTRNGMFGSLTYDANLFEARTISAFVDRLSASLVQVVQDPESRLSVLRERWRTRETRNLATTAALRLKRAVRQTV